MISVVIPLYNKAHTIVKTLNTVMCQTYNDFEVIIVNDGSTDNGVEVIKMNFSDRRIRIINQENAGVGAARNRGAEEARGEWLAFLDGDDEWLPSYLQTMVNAMEQHPQSDIIGCASYYKDLSTGEVSAHALIDKYKDRSVEINYFINPDKMTHIGATLLRKSVFFETGGFDTRLRKNEDVLLLGSIAMHRRLVYVGECLHVYVGGVAGQATSDMSRLDADTVNYVEVLNKFYELYEKGGKRNRLVRISIKYRGRHILLGLIKTGQYKLLSIAFEHFSLSLKRLFAVCMFLCRHRLYKLCVYYIYFTKLIWRLHGFPRVGAKSRYNDGMVQRYFSVQP